MWQQRNDSSAPLYWQTFPEVDSRGVVENYLALDVPLPQLYMDWLRAEPAIAPAIRAFHGLRILRQPPVECFFSFQCATCNTVVKIERTVAALAERYGRPLEAPQAVPTIAGVSDTDVSPAAAIAPSARASLHAFPEIGAMAQADDAALRADLWGYRAPRLIALARLVEGLGEAWLDDLRRVSYEEAKARLVQLPGIGEKIADCICLFCADKTQAVPVDTHVRQIACRLFTPELAQRSLTPRVYSAIGNAFRDRFGEYAGWAQQYLFLGAMRAGRGANGD